MSPVQRIDLMWNPTPGASDREWLKPSRKQPPFARMILGFDLFGPNITDGHIMKVWTHCADQDGVHRRTLIRTTHESRLREWFARWLDVDVATIGVFKGARGPDEHRAAHKGGRAELFGLFLDQMGKPPRGCCFPTYDWMNGPLYWPDMLAAVSIELNGKPWTITGAA